MKNRMNGGWVFSYILLLLCVSNDLHSQANQITLNHLDSGHKTYIANQKIEFLPGYSFASSSANTMIAYIDAGIITPSYYADLFTESTFDNYQLNTNYSVGSISGTSNVSETGAFNYSIPIQIPLGTNGMVPQIAIGYSSQSGNGLLGMGWGLQGLSVISRTNKDLYYDGEVKSVQFDDKDVFSLDGEKLIGISGTYGANGAIYATESENFSRIYSHGNSGNGPEWFEVKTKEGLTIQYGKTTDARLTNGALALFWMVNKITDAKGNYVEYVYEIVNDELRIKEIRYTGNSTVGLSPYNIIRFNYKERADPFNYFIQYKKVENRSILDNIVVLAEGQLFKKYEFKYGCKLYSFLNEVIEYGTGEERFNSTVFKYETETGEISLVSDVLPSAYVNDNVINLTGDFNGDGKTDILKVTSSSSTAGKDRAIISQQINYQVLSNNSNNPDNFNFQSIGNASISSSTLISFGYGRVPYYKGGNSGMNLFDFDGDGKTDLFYYGLDYDGSAGLYSVSSVHFLRAQTNQGQVSFQNISGNINIYGPSRYVLNPSRFSFIGDYDGDGIFDVLLITQNQYGGDVNLHIIKGSSVMLNSFPVGVTNQQVHNLSLSDKSFISSADRIEVVDFDGDGKSDIMVVNGSSTQIYTFNKSSISENYPNVITNNYAEKIYDAGFPTKWHEFELGDFNGDGRSDILTASDDGAKFIVHYSRSDNWFQPIDYTFKNTFFDANNDGLIVADLNGDGISDIIHHYNHHYVLSGTNYNNKSEITTYYSNGEKFDYTDSKLLSLSSTNIALEHRIASNRLIIGNFKEKPVNSIILPIEYGEYPQVEYQEPVFTLLTTRFHQLDLKIPNNLNAMTRIKDGFNNEISIEYGNISSNNIGEYAETITNPPNTNYPTINFTNPLRVVKKINTHTPTGSIASTEYDYWGGKFHKIGKGFLGFSKTVQSNLLTGVTHSSEYEFHESTLQTYLKRGVTYFTDNQALISETEYEHSFITTLPNNRYLHYVHEETVTDHINARTVVKVNDYNNETGNLNSTTIDNNGIETTLTTFDAYGTFGTDLNIPNMVTQSTTTITRTGETPFSSVSHFDYDVETGNPTDVIQNYGTPENITKELDYDQYGNVTKETISAAGITPRIKENVYDSKGIYVIKHINALGQESFVQYHPIFGKPVKITDIHGLITQMTYDGFGREITTTNPMGNILTKSYEWVNISPPNSSGNPLQAEDVMWKFTTSGAGIPQQVTYLNKSGMKRKSTVQGMDDNILIVTSYNERGQVFMETAPFFEGTSEVLLNEYTYDDFNRLIKTENQTGETTVVYQPTGGGLKTTTSFPDGAIKVKEEDASGKLIKATDEGGTLIYSYFSHGGVKNVKLDGVTVTTSEYDNLGRQTKLIDANAGETSYTYNVLGELMNQTNANNKTTQMTYDAVGRLNQRTMLDRTLDMEYYTQGNGLNQIKKIIYNEGTEEFVYDQLQRPLEVKRTIDGQEFIFKYTYNQFGNVEKLEYPNGYFVNNTYDNKGYLIKVSDPDNTILWKADQKNAVGKITKFTKGDGIQTEMKYSDLNILEEIKAGNIQHYTYNFNIQNGNLTQRTDMIKALTETFEYDETERLTNALSSPASNPMLVISNTETEYASNGNISFKTDVGNYAYHPEKINAVTGIENPNELISFNTQQITYNAFSKTKTITEGNKRMYFTYSSDDERVMTKLVELDGNNETTLMKKYFFGLYEKEVEGSLERHINYVSAGDGITAIVVEENSERNTYYTYKDHLGSIVAITDEEGGLFFEQSFDAWGKYRNTDNWTYSNIVETPTWLRGYTGHEHLAHFDIVNMNGRMYDPTIGRMLRPDNLVQEPTNSQSYNRYSYAWNNPLKYTDPNGEFVWAPIIIGAAIGGISGYFAGRANGMKGGDLAGYIFIGGVMGSVTGMMGGSITSSIGMNIPTHVSGIFAASAGASISSAVSGGGFSVLNGGDMTEGIWKGAVTGFAGGLVGTSVGGGAGGAFLGGAASGAVRTALDNGDGDDIMKSAIIGGMFSLGAYHIQHASSYAAYKKAGGSWTYNQHYEISEATQRSFAWGKEAGGWILDNGEIELWKMIKRDEINRTIRPSNATEWFHTHPNWGNGWVENPSPSDIFITNSIVKMEAYVIGRQNVYFQNPSFNPFVLFNSSHGYFNTYPFNFYGSMSPSH